MNFQVLDSGIFTPAKKEEPKIVDTAPIREQMRIDAGFPKVIKVTVGESSCRLFVEGDDIYAESDDCPVSVEIIPVWRLPYEHDWRRIEYEVLC